ncbi:MAG: non-canonical purine NTP pyrophosphatase [Saprospiraceae bacterium]
MDEGRLLVFATNNMHKVKELNDILEKDKLDWVFRSLEELDIVEDIEENGITLDENAKIKSSYIWNKYHKNSVGEDTGLEVEALNGAPGVYSARYAGNEKNDQANMNKLLAELDGITHRNARFRTVISLVLAGEEFNLRNREWADCDNAARKPRIWLLLIFIPEGYNESFGVLGKEVKSLISHRARAVKKLIEFLKMRS